MKFWGFVLPIIFLFSCQSEKKESNFVTFSGHIKNAKIDSVFVILNEREKGFALDFDGNFSDTVQLNDEGYKTFAIDRNEFSLYLMPGDSLFFAADLDNFDDTYFFKGKGADRNNYLYEKDTLLNSWFSNEKLYKLEPQEYLDNIKDLSVVLKKSLKDKGLESSFMKIEQKNIFFDEFNLLYSYRDSYAYFNPSKPQLPINFLDFSKFNLDNQSDYNQFKSYRNIVLYYFDEQLNRGFSPVDLIKNLKSENIKNDFIRILIDNLDPTDTNSKVYYEAIQSFCTYKPWLDEANKIMDNRK